MRYELFLRRASALADDERTRLKAQIKARSPALSCELLDQTSSPCGVDLGLEADHAGAADLLLDAALEQAEALSLSIYDPQLSRAIGEADREAVSEKIAQLESFFAVGLVDSAAQQVGSSASRRLWLMIGGLLIVALVLMRALRCAA